MSFTHQIINGKILPKEQALIPLTDLGLLRAYAVFDYFRILDRVPVFIEDHLDRMFRSARTMELAMRWDREETRQMILDLIDTNEAIQAGCRVVITGGFSEDGFTPTEPNLYMMLHTLPTYDPQDWVKGCTLITSEYVRDIPSVKTCIYVQSLLERKRMQEAGAVEVLFHHKGSITECSRSNIFFVTPENVLVTPADSMLHGITRKQVLAISEEAGIPIELRDIHLEELPWVREAFITSSTRGVLPIIHIGHTQIGNGSPGTISLQLHQAFQTFVQRTIQATKSPAL
jgi:branched-subunit amino acid aminotransferase/4-amino-4-deoxychorismate lyase